MKNDAAMKQKLERVLGSPLQVELVSLQAWQQMLRDEPKSEEETMSIIQEGRVLFPWKREGLNIELFAIDERRLSSAERQLVEWLLQSLGPSAKGQSSSTSEEERKALQIANWLHEQLQSGVDTNQDVEVPDSISLKTRLFTSMIPFLLVCEQSHPTTASYGPLYKLLKSYFGGEVCLIPLEEKEWLILCAEDLLFAAGNEDNRDDEAQEKPEELLASFCEGLYELLANEWLGESYLTISYPIIPVRALPAAVRQLRETIYLGRAFHVTANIHLPWELHMERLINSIPDAERKQFIDRVVDRTDLFMEAETLTTLEAFFQLDCNVSDTAKKLYIHRNTLLYRLDKIKQETGLDVRTFSDAVLVKLILLLYKVTKRK